MDTPEAVAMAGLCIGVVIAAAAFLLVYPPMRRLMAANAILRAARPFYARTFFIVMLLAAWAPILGIVGSVSSDKSSPETMTFMDAVWKVAAKIDNVCWSVVIFLAIYVVVITIVYAALGRFRDQPESQAESR
jgi:cytochrome c biogenesis factor